MKDDWIFQTNCTIANRCCVVSESTLSTTNSQLPLPSLHEGEDTNHVLALSVLELDDLKVWEATEDYFTDDLHVLRKRVWLARVDGADDLPDGCELGLV